MKVFFFVALLAFAFAAEPGLVDLGDRAVDAIFDELENGATLGPVGKEQPQPKVKVEPKAEPAKANPQPQIPESPKHNDEQYIVDPSAKKPAETSAEPAAVVKPEVKSTTKVEEKEASTKESAPVEVTTQTQQPKEPSAQKEQPAQKEQEKPVQKEQVPAQEQQAQEQPPAAQKQPTAKKQKALKQQGGDTGSYTSSEEYSYSYTSSEESDEEQQQHQSSKKSVKTTTPQLNLASGARNKRKPAQKKHDSRLGAYLMHTVLPRWEQAATNTDQRRHGLLPLIDPVFVSVLARQAAQPEHTVRQLVGEKMPEFCHAACSHKHPQHTNELYRAAVGLARESDGALCQICQSTPKPQSFPTTSGRHNQLLVQPSSAMSKDHPRAIPHISGLSEEDELTWYDVVKPASNKMMDGFWDRLADVSREASRGNAMRHPYAAARRNRVVDDDDQGIDREMFARLAERKRNRDSGVEARPVVEQPRSADVRKMVVDDASDDLTADVEDHVQAITSLLQRAGAARLPPAQASTIRDVSRRLVQMNLARAEPSQELCAELAKIRAQLVDILPGEEDGLPLRNARSIPMQTNTLLQEEEGANTLDSVLTPVPANQLPDPSNYQ